jgi:hypothetical protein
MKPDTDISELMDTSGQSFVNLKTQIDYMIKASKGDMQQFLSFDKVDLNVVDTIDKAIQRKYIIGLLNDSDPNDSSNSYLISIVEFGCILAECIINEISGFYWLYDYPYWESVIVHKPTGTVVPIFHWAIKKYSAYGVEDGFKNKIIKMKEVLENEIK